MFVKAILGCLFLISGSALAGGSAKLTNYIEERVFLAENAMQSEHGALGMALKRAQLEAFNLDFTATASFGLSEVLQISVAPEIDLVFVPAPTPASRFSELP